MSKIKFGKAFLIPVLFLLIGCQNKGKEVAEEQETSLSHRSEDFTTLGEFTKGIEGPAVDKEGNIYAVNFAEEGTIGIVSPGGKSSLFVTLPGRQHRKWNSR